MQLHFAPQKQRRKQLEAAEKLCGIIGKNKEYPFEFVCFRITGFSPKKADAGQLIKGDELLEDLRIFISKLSGQVAALASEQGEKVRSIEQLAEILGVSTKTIHRWRKRGLIARKFVFDDGVKRLGFLQSSFDRFRAANPKLIGKAKKFTRLTVKQKKQMIKEAARLAARTNLSRYRIIDKIAAKFDRVHETVRYIILNCEKAYPDKPIFRKPSGVIGTAQAAEVHRLFLQGRSIEDLTKRFDRSKSSIYRIINQRRAKELLAKKIDFLPSDEFNQSDAKEKILGASLCIIRPTPTVVVKAAEPFEPTGKSAFGGLPEYLRTLKDAPVLSRDREAELFRRYNYLKYLASAARAGIRPERTPSAVLKQIENYLAEADTIKKMIIEANLRLVVGIAMKHTITGANLMDLISRGNLSLVEEVERFDYTKAYRFGRRVGWAIAKEYARRIPSALARAGKVAAALLARMGTAEGELQTAADIAAIEKARQSLTQVISNNLTEREQYVIQNHFGLLGSLVKKKKKTLKQIGDELELSKERVRQIELIALQKLRQSLSPQEFELLTG